ncbi:BTB/POZ domain-containing protein 7-like [Diadema setosum]|uniref:BTB/POZ domain-containing protein 7-like n=1 Tax=Diadema setosum TaxID=31175 RepID=UPI003B3A2AED
MGSNPSSQRDSPESPGDEPRTSSREHAGTMLPSSHHGPLGDEVLETPRQTLPSPSKIDKVKKKKPPSFSSLKRKIVRRKTAGKFQDHARSMRDLIATWNPLDVCSLIEEYDALAALKEVTIQTDLARPSALPLKNDLLQLFNSRLCADVNLIFKGTVFPAHRAILSARCSFFRELLRRNPTVGAEVQVDLGWSGVTVNMFSALLRYLYTGEFNTQDSELENLDVLIRLGERFGTPNALEQDLRMLLETGHYGDAALVFSCDAESSGAHASETARTVVGSSVKCHKAILAARSPFFHSVLQRRQQSSSDSSVRTLPSITRIVLDESVIPKKYVHVLLFALYQDTVDLSLVLPDSPSVGSLGEAQAMASGRTPLTKVEQAMELYQIARFLDFTTMAQACEDIIARSITTENLVSILTWSLEPHGSHWVHRQAQQYLQEEFCAVAASPVLFELRESQLIMALKSDFLQVAEADILKAVVRWGEYQLIKRMEEREPNLVSHTQHSVSRKGIKRRDLDTGELREIISSLLPLVRLEHIIPRDHEALTGAVKRGLIPTPPSHMLSGDELARVNPWVRGKGRRHYPRPRLFTPYVEEAKSFLEEPVVSDMDSSQRGIRMSYVPDALYMLDERGACSERWTSRVRSYPPSVIAGSFPAPDEDTVKAMRAREKELQRSAAAKRAYSLRCTDSMAVSRELQTRVVREFGLPDEAVEVFDTPPEEDCEGHGSTMLDDSDLEVFGRMWNEPPDLHHRHTPAHHTETTATAEVVPMLSEIMPDIAIPSGPDLTIATAPPINQMLMREPELWEERRRPQGRDKGKGSKAEGSQTKV